MCFKRNIEKYFIGDRCLYLMDSCASFKLIHSLNLYRPNFEVFDLVNHLPNTFTNSPVNLTNDM